MNEPIFIVAGARPNFMKVAPLIKELKKRGQEVALVNTAQHFDKNMAGDFFKELNINPEFELSPSRDSSVKQFADILVGLEDTMLSYKPKLVVVVGDVDSTLAAALAAKKLGITIAHVEAGLRSFNSQMAEERNRIMVDHISDLLFVTMEDGVKNLKREGITEGIHEVGNIMIDTLDMFLPEVDEIKGEYYFCTLHRAENVDKKKVFSEILDALEEISKDSKIYIPLHPRTKKRAEEFGLENRLDSIFCLLDPLSYTSSIAYKKNAKLVLTDSGGIQEETSYLGVPCLTLREETERPITVTKGTNVIAGVSKKSILKAYRDISFERMETNIPFWDGNAASRIVEIISSNG